MSAPTLVIYTEDSGKDADATLDALIRRLVVRVEPLARPERVTIQPVQGEPREAIHGHRWKERKKDTLKRALVRDLATRLTTGDFIVFHYDGDRPWDGRLESSHDAAISGLLAQVKTLLQADEIPPNFLRLVPFYSVESWLYLNQKAVNELVEGGHAPRAALGWLDDNRDQRGGYDGVIKPKDACPLGARWNLRLAEQDWSAKQAARRSPSWLHVEESWKGATDLQRALRATSDVPEEDPETVA